MPVEPVQFVVFGDRDALEIFDPIVERVFIDVMNNAAFRHRAINRLPNFNVERTNASGFMASVGPEVPPQVFVF